ncbi:MAG: hypothetical protein C5B51_28805 [Terriglobia bacterium]|nr:MAG: hypothetical protein C5B51_28805 [Terriglobia bacterium]
MLVPRAVCVLTVMTGVVLVSAAWGADTALVVDRGLPQANINNVAGAARSNVRWHNDEQGFLGDDFTIGNRGEKWVIDSIRTWTVPGLHELDPDHLGDFFQDVRLYVGTSGAGLTPRGAAALSQGTDETGDANIRVSDATAAGAPLYDDFGKALRVWQIDFTGLHIVVDGGIRYGFGVWGMGRPIPGADSKTYQWFNHASNASLSGARQDGADGAMLLFDASGKAEGSFDGQGNGWDKSSDINVQVFAHRVDGHTAKAELARE